ncbi:MAG: hypothetical protein KJ955_00840 [Nanoarchaeota archaeon]|nr:hypothetical protein [Nanoarchaeota archaeon]
MSNNKRGQVTMFVILGIIVVALIVLLFAFKDQVIPKTASVENLDATMQNINKHVRDCLAEASDEPIKRIGLQGGYLVTPENSYRRWDDYPISYLCYNQAEKETCTNRFLTKEKMQEQLSEAIKEALGTCLDIEGAAEMGLIKTFTLQRGDTMDVNVEILPEQVNIELKHDVQLKSKKGDVTKKQGVFETTVRSPLGELYEVALDILDAETTMGRFDQLTYMLSKMSRYTIYLNKPYPDKIYVLKLREKDYVFQFAVEGEPS